MDSIANQLQGGKAPMYAKQLYINALRNEADTSEANHQSLAMAAHVLGKSPDQAKADVVVIRQIKKLEAQRASVDQAATEFKTASDRLDAFDQESANIQAKRVERRKQLAGEVATARANANDAKNAELELQQIRNTNPDLFF